MDVVVSQFFYYLMIQVMQKHQKYFGIADNSGRLLPYFIAVRLILVYTPVFFGAECTYGRSLIIYDNFGLISGGKWRY